MGKRRGEEEKERREGEARSLPYQSKNRSCAPGLSICLSVCHTRELCSNG